MKKRVSYLLIMICVSSLPVLGLSFKQVAYIPSGMIWGYGYIETMDFNDDGFQDMVFGTDLNSQIAGVVYYSYRPYNSYSFQDSFRYAEPWDAGYLDQDSLLDVVTQAWDSSQQNSYIRVYEAANRYSFPKNLVWSWPYEYYGRGVQPMYITDLDKDGLKEILTADAQVIYIFENRGNNQYQMIFSDTLLLNFPTGPFAFGDYDGDGRMEFVVPTYGGNPSDSSVYVYKCTGNDQYQKCWGVYLNTVNMIDCITGPDLDGDGKPEFIIGSLRTGTPYPWKGCLWIYEATGINNYQLIFSDSISVTDRGVYCVHSDCGDIDRDGRPELVWAIDRDWMVYKYDSLGHRFQRVFSAYGDNGHNSTNIHIHDMNGNGYPEIIESGGNETHIWEVEACQVVYPNGGETLYCDTSYTIRWRNVSPFVADSFSLFFSADSSRTYSSIAHGLPGSDSAYTWTVPDTVSSRCFLMLWAYQNATGWDFSDGPFTVRPAVGVEVFPPHASHLTPYVPCPNPFVSYATVPGHEAESFALYDVSGRKVGNYKGSRIGYNLSVGIYFLKPKAQDAKPLRIVKLR